MATAIRRRAIAIAGEAAAIRRASSSSSSSPAVVSVRKLASFATPRLPAAASSVNTLRLSSATATVRNGIYAPLRRTHTDAAVEARIVELENKIVMMQLELKKEMLDAQDKFVRGQATLNDRMSNLGHFVLAEGRRNVTRAANSSAEHARAVLQVGKVTWRVVVTVVGAAGSTGFAVAQLIRADTKSKQETVAGDLISARTAELQSEFATKLEASVERAVDLALAKEARRRSLSDEDTMHAINARLEDLLKGLDDKIDRTVDLALSKRLKELKIEPKGK